jgi:hypothetical protein
MTAMTAIEATNDMHDMNAMKDTNDMLAKHATSP